MKLVLEVIVNKDDSGTVLSALTQEGSTVTKNATTGGLSDAKRQHHFSGGVDDGRLDDVIRIIERHSKKRSQMIPSTTYNNNAHTSIPVEVTVGGATVFKLNVERYERL